MPFAIIFLMLLVPISFLIFNGRPFYKQLRVGMHERNFYLYKLRSMHNFLGENGLLLPDSQRTCSWGNFLRRHSLDEIPQLWNVVKGDLSMVGPRPLPVGHLKYMTGRERERHAVLPGLTGLVQVSGRNKLSWNKRFQLDLLYIKVMSISYDLRIISHTLLQLFFSKNVESTISIIHARTHDQKFFKIY